MRKNRILDKQKPGKEGTKADTIQEGKEEVRKEKGELGPDTQVKQIETVVFIPATPASGLKNILQKQDDTICLATNCPQVRFVERACVTVMEELGRSNPWAKEWCYNRKDCAPFQGRGLLAAEAKDENLKLAQQGDSPKGQAIPRT